MGMMMNRFSIVALLGFSTALIAPGMARAACEGTGDADCPANADVVVRMPVQPNTELETVPDLDIDGFEISVDGNVVSETGTVTAQKGAKVRRQDIALNRADVAVQFDGLGVKPRLTMGLGGAKPGAGGTVRLRNEMNYPAFVTRGEVRVIDPEARGGPATVAVVPAAPNSTVALPTGQAAEGGELLYVYRVYDARGRYDETSPATIDDLDRRGLTPGTEEGQDRTSTSRIPVFGGAVTVSGSGLGANGEVRTLGETIQADGDGEFVLQRILPTGQHVVEVDTGSGRKMWRDIDVPASDLFYVGIVDITLGKTIKDELQEATDPAYDDTFQRGRVAFYLKGKVKGDVLITAAMDSGEEDFKDFFRNLDEKNPQALIDRIDPDEFYPVYGDDSTAENDAPTSGKLYVKIERDDSHVMWGNFKSEVRGTEFLRMERTLYGAQGVYRSPAQTSHGEARVEAQIYAAQPDTLPQRDVFLGTGGSTYFLKFQDITRGSETVLVEIQDPDTGQIVGRETLVYGVDYEINYIQGLITLNRPLSASTGAQGPVVNNPNGDNNAYLVVTYEHTPTVGQLDSFSYGGRVQVWANDKVRLGFTAMNEDLGTTDQTALGVDLLFRHSERTYVELEYAETDGTGRDQDLSYDGGLTLDTQAGIAGTGRAFRFRGQADLREMGANVDGLIGGYYEDRTAGFSSLNYRTLNDETLWGVYAEVEPSEALKFRLEYDELEDSTGRRLREGEMSVAWKPNAPGTLEVGVQHRDEIDPAVPADTGTRTDVGLRYTYEPNEAYKVYAYGQATVARSGMLGRNDRIGIGGEVQLNPRLRFSGEISDGSTGPGGRALFEFEADENTTTYIGYTLDPDREFNGIALNGRDGGTYVAGGRRKVNEHVTYFGESTYDLFGEHTSLSQAYGVEYTVDQQLSFDLAFEGGRIRDRIANTDFDRRALSFGATYSAEDLDWRGRLEYRVDRGVQVGSNRNGESVAGEFRLRYKFSENARMLLGLEGVYSTNTAASIPDARYGQATLGYAYRPIDNDRLNVLARYTYYYDMTERVASNPAAGGNFLTTPRQRAHILSVDASYDLNQRWTLGAKVGGRWSKQDVGTGFVSNNATLAVLNARYHLVHKWDLLFEVRQLNAQDIGKDTGALAAVYRHIGNNFKLGVGYNGGRFSDDLRDVTYDDRGVFINIVGKF